MLKPYICEGTIVKIYGTIGRVIGVDRKNQVVTVQLDRKISSVKLDSIQVLSYREVK